MVSEKAIEDLLNSLGSQLAKDYYGLDINFSVVELKEKYGQLYVVVKPDRHIPMTFDVKIEPNMNAGRFARISDLTGNLEYLMKYIGVNDVYIQIKPEHVPERFKTMVSNDDYIKHPQSYVKLESVGHVLEIDTGYVYPLYQNNKIDVDVDFTHLSEIYEDDWWDSLSPEDIHTLENIYS